MTQNKSLKHLEVYWEKLLPQYMERFKTFFKNLPRLESFKLVYSTPFETHGANHERILYDLEACLREIKRINFITINTSCGECRFKNISSLREIESFERLEIISEIERTPVSNEKIVPHLERLRPLDVRK